MLNTIWHSCFFIILLLNLLKKSNKIASLTFYLFFPTHFINSIKHVHLFSCKILYIYCSVNLLSDCSHKDRQSSPVSIVEELYDCVKVSRRSQYLFLPAFSNQVRPKLNLLRLILHLTLIPPVFFFHKKSAFFICCIIYIQVQFRFHRPHCVMSLIMTH